MTLDRRLLVSCLSALTQGDLLRVDLQTYESFEFLVNSPLPQRPVGSPSSFLNGLRGNDVSNAVEVLVVDNILLYELLECSLRIFCVRLPFDLSV